MNTIPSIEDIRARRKALAAEDRLLSEMEASLLEVANRWREIAHIVPKSAAIDAPANLVVVDAATNKMLAPRRTKNSMIIDALNSPHPLWQTATQIQQYMTKETGKDVPMSSISPALTALKNSGTIVRKDMLVALALRAETEEPWFFKENGEALASPETGEPDRSPIETQEPEKVTG